MALKELKEELNNSKRDCADKDEVIRSITSQRHEIQENLDEALEQVCLPIWLFSGNDTALILVLFTWTLL